jgi:hypothetical protein
LAAVHLIDNLLLGRSTIDLAADWGSAVEQKIIAIVLLIVSLGAIWVIVAALVRRYRTPTLLSDNGLRVMTCGGTRHAVPRAGPGARSVPGELGASCRSHSPRTVEERNGGRSNAAGKIGQARARFGQGGDTRPAIATNRAGCRLSERRRQSPCTLVSDPSVGATGPQASLTARKG